MAAQDKVQMREGYALDNSGVVSNAATNADDLKAVRAALRGDGTEIAYFLEVRAKRIVSDEAIYVDGDSIRLADGVVHARNLVSTEQIIANSAQIADTIILPGHISTPDLSALSANLGNITAGSIGVHSGGVTISNDGGASGIYIGDNQIYSKVAGVKTLWWDGDSGVISTGLPGEARTEYMDEGITIYDAADSARTLLTVTGLEVRNASGSTPTAPEEISFVGHTGTTREGTLFYDHDTHLFYMANYPGDGSVTGYVALGPTTAGFIMSGESYLQVGTHAYLVSVNGEVQLNTAVNGTHRIQFYDGRMTNAVHVHVPLVDYDIVAITTGVTNENDLAFTWTAGNHVSAPDLALACAVNNASDGCKYINVGVKTSTSTGGTVDWMTVDGSTQSSATNIVIIGVWL
jgi:hypothetical protein